MQRIYNLPSVYHTDSSSSLSEPRVVVGYDFLTLFQQSPEWHSFKSFRKLMVTLCYCVEEAEPSDRRIMRFSSVQFATSLLASLQGGLPNMIMDNF